MKILITEDCFMEMARVGFVPVGTTKTIEVYVHTDDPGKTPHFHVRKYGKNNQFEWETCIQYEKAEYFLHGKYKDKLPNQKITKELDKMMRTKKSGDKYGRTYFDYAVEMWNDNNSDVILPDDIIQPDYTKLK